jgi:hypothetical protein
MRLCMAHPTLGQIHAPTSRKTDDCCRQKRRLARPERREVALNTIPSFSPRGRHNCLYVRNL